MAFEIKGGVIDLQELMPLEDRTRPTLFYDWDKQHSGQVPVNSVEAAVDGPIYDLRAYLQSDKGAYDGPPEVTYNGEPLGAGDVTPEIEQEWQTFLKVANDHFRLTMDTFDYSKTDRAKGSGWVGGNDGAVDFEFSTMDHNRGWVRSAPGEALKWGSVPEGEQPHYGRGPRLTVRGLYDSENFITGWDSSTNVLRVKDGPKIVKSVEVDVGDRIWDSLLEHGASFASSHPAIQQRFPGVAEGSIRRESDGSYQLYDKAPTDGGQPIPDNRYNSDFSPMGVGSGVSGTPGAAGLPSTGADLLATTLAERQGATGTTAEPPIAESAPPVSTSVENARLMQMMLSSMGGQSTDPNRPVGEAVLGQGDTFYVDGVGAIEVDENGVPQYNQSQMRDIFKSYLRTQIGSDHPGIDQFVDAYLGNETVAPRGAPPTNMRDWAIQQQLDRILRDKGVTSGDSTFSSEASSGGLASISDTGSVGSGLSGALGVLGDLGMGAGAGGLDLSAFINSLPGVSVGDLNLPDVGLGDLGLPGVGVGDLGLPDLTANDLNLPNVGIGDLGLPDVGVGDLNLPGLSVSDLGIPGLNVGDLGLPNVTVDDLGLPNVGVGDLGLPGVNLQDLGLPGINLSDLGLPNIGVGDLGLPGVNVSDLGLPNVGVGDLNLPGVSVGDLGLPGVGLGDLGLPNVGVGDLGLPSVGVGDLGLPNVGVGDLGLPSVGVGDLGLPNVGVGDLGLPGVSIADLGLPDITAGDLNLPSLAGLNTGVSSLEDTINALNIPTLDNLAAQLSQLSNIRVPNFDSLTSALGGAEGTVAGIIQQLSNLNIPSMPDLSGLGGIEGALSSLIQRINDTQAPDFGGVEGAVGGLEQRVNQLGLPDFSGTSLADLGLNLSAGDMGTALSSYFGGANPLAAINQSLTDLLGKDFGGGDVFNEYVTNVEGGGGGAAFDPVAFGRGLAGSAAAPHGYDYLNMGFLDLLRQAQAQGIVGPGIAGGGGLDPSALQSGLGQFFFGDDYAPTVGPGGVFDDLGFLGANSLDAFLNNQFMDFRTGLGLGEEQTLPDLISSLIPAQPQLDPMFTDPTQFFDQLVQALETAVTGTAHTFTDGTAAPTSWYPDDATAGSGAGGTAAPDAIQFDAAPALELPAITDFSDFLRYPLYEGLSSAIGSPNPFDTRRDAITKGPLNAIDRQYDESRENLINRYGTMNMMGSPAFHSQMRKLERDRSDAGLQIESDFGMEAARTDEPLRRNRLADLSAALTGERGYVRDEQQFQYDLQKDQEDRYAQHIVNQINAWNAPQNYDDEGLRLALGGIGSNLSPAISSSLQSLAGIFAGAGNQISNNNNTLANAFGNKNGQKGLWG